MAAAEGRRDSNMAMRPGALLLLVLAVALLPACDTGHGARRDCPDERPRARPLPLLY